MRQLLMIAVATGGLSLTFGGSTAMAGYCGNGVQPVACQGPIAPPPAAPCAAFVPPMIAPPALNCQTPVVVRPSTPNTVDPVVVTTTQPMGYLRSVKMHNSPHVNIMRVHGQNTGVSVKDAPTGFTGGCNPSSTTYCGQSAVRPAPIAAAPRPYVAAPIAAPVQTVQHQSRQYGSTGMVRGTAYLPTSHVNRDYQTAVNVLNSGPIPARPAVNGGDVPHPSMFNGASGYSSHAMRGAMIAPRVMASPMIAAPQPARPAIGPGPGNWEKVSGPTTIGGLPATQVVCRRPAPKPAPVTCVRQVIQAPLVLAGAPYAPRSTARYGSSGH